MKKSFIISLIFIFLMLIGGCSNYLSASGADESPKTLENRKFILWNDTLTLGNETYERLEDNILAISLNAKIGYTDTGAQIFSIDNDNEFIVMRENGYEYLFKNAETSKLILENFDVNRFEMKDRNKLDAPKTNITELKTIDSLIEQLNKNNLVKFPQNITEGKDLFLYSREENVMLHLLYLHDDQENCFIYNFVDDNVWKINHLLMEQ